jgi:hypothetical protein
MKLQSTAYLLVTFQSIIHYKVENLISRCLYNTNCFCHRQLHSFATKAVTKKIYKYCPKSFHRNVFCNCCCCEAWPLGKEACNLHGRFKTKQLKLPMQRGSSWDDTRSSSDPPAWPYIWTENLMSPQKISILQTNQQRTNKVLPKLSMQTLCKQSSRCEKWVGISDTLKQSSW